MADGHPRPAGTHVVARAGPRCTPGTHRGRALRARHGARTGPSSARPQSSSTCRRRTWSTPTPTATSATRPRARSRSGARRRRAPTRDSGRRRAGTRRYDWTGLRAVRPDAVVVQPARGLHRHGQPGGRRPARALPDLGLGLRLPGPADPQRCSQRHGKIAADDMRRSSWTTASRSPRRWCPTCCGSTCVDDPFTREAQQLLRGWDFTDGDATSAPAAYYNAVWSNLLQLTFDDELVRRSAGRRRRPLVRRRGAAAQGPEATPGGTTRATPGSSRAATRSCARRWSTRASELTQELGKDPARGSGAGCTA